MKLTEGDTIEVMSNKVDQPNRRGVVQRVLQDDPIEIEVAWEDGHVSTFLPMGGNVRVESRAS